MLTQIAVSIVRCAVVARSIVLVSAVEIAVIGVSRVGNAVVGIPGVVSSLEQRAKKHRYQGSSCKRQM